jgi:UDP-N-acetylmuramyl tripeptide synthase
MGESINQDKLIAALADVKPAFGRGETIIVNGKPLELVLVKNPSGFRLGLQSFPPAGYATMIAINDNYADGRDMSWLWDVSFESLQSEGVALISGIRAYDMTLRLQYDEVPIASVEPHLKRALKQFLAENADMPKRIYCTYTAMLAIRRDIATLTKVEAIG